MNQFNCSCRSTPTKTMKKDEVLDQSSESYAADEGQICSLPVRLVFHLQLSWKSARRQAARHHPAVEDMLCCLPPYDPASLRESCCCCVSPLRASLMETRHLPDSGIIPQSIGFPKTTCSCPPCCSVGSCYGLNVTNGFSGSTWIQFVSMRFISGLTRVLGAHVVCFLNECPLRCQQPFARPLLINVSVEGWTTLLPNASASHSYTHRDHSGKTKCSCPNLK